MLYRYVLALFLIAVFCQGGSSVGTLVSANSVLLNGKAVPASATPSWPLADQDQVATTTGSASAILFHGGSRAMMKPETTVKVFQKEGETQLDISQGAICSKIVKGSAVHLFALGRDLGIQAPFEGTVSLNSSGQSAIRRMAC